MWKLVILILVITLTLAADKRPQYTQDLETFKKDNHKQRLQLLVGCWLMARQHRVNTTDAQMLALVKVCLKHITRKDSVLKITSLIGKNMSSTKSYSQVVPQQQIPEADIVSSTDGEFNLHLLKMIKNYQKDLSGVQGSQGQQIKKRIDEQIQKRQKYYFGFIPANQFTQMMMLITISIIVIMFCTCWKYYNMRKMQTEAKKKQKQDYFMKKSNSSFTKNKNLPKMNNINKKNQ